MVSIPEIQSLLKVNKNFTINNISAIELYCVKFTHFINVGNISSIYVFLLDYIYIIKLFLNLWKRIKNMILLMGEVNQ